MAKHPEHQSTMKHVHRANHWMIGKGLIAVSHVPGDDNPADIFTKPLGRVKFAKFRAMLMLELMIPPTSGRVAQWLEQLGKSRVRSPVWPFLSLSTAGFASGPPSGLGGPYWAGELC